MIICVESKNGIVFRQNMLQLPPIPTSILEISDIVIEGAKINNSGAFIITVANEKKEINCSKCNSPTSPRR